MVKAAIDIGSNSVLLLVKEGDRVLENVANVTALGRGIDKTKEFSKIAMSETIEVLLNYKSLILKHGLLPENVIVTATEASRVVENSKDFFKTVKDQMGFSVLVISGEQEALYSTKGVLSSGYQYDIVTIMDIGGASTELIKARTSPFEIINSVSMPIGAVRVNDADNKNEYIEEKIGVFDLKNHLGEVMLATAGTMTSLAAMMLKMSKYEDDIVHNTTFTVEDFEKFGKLLFTQDENEIGNQYPFLGKRRFTIKSGYLIASKVFKKMEFKKFTVSSRGLRYGTIDMESL